MADAQMVERADNLIERLSALNEAMESADAFCAYLKELTAHKRFGDGIPGDAVRRRGSPRRSDRWVHAGIVRAAIGTIMACLDLRTCERQPGKRRTDRSIAQGQNAL